MIEEFRSNFYRILEHNLKCPRVQISHKLVMIPEFPNKSHKIVEDLLNCLKMLCLYIAQILEYHNKLHKITKDYHRCLKAHRYLNIRKNQLWLSLDNHNIIQEPPKQTLTLIRSRIQDNHNNQE